MHSDRNAFTAAWSMSCSVFLLNDSQPLGQIHGWREERLTRSFCSYATGTEERAVIFSYIFGCVNLGSSSSLCGGKLGRGSAAHCGV